MKDKWKLTPEAFERLLSWLSPDREKAAERYVEIRRRLIRLFTWRGCDCPEQLADNTIDRVARKVCDDEVPEFSGDRIFYFLSVSTNIYREYLKSKTNQEKIHPDDLAQPEPRYSEQESRCLDSCLPKLTPKSRGLVTKYFEYQGQEKIRTRQALADDLGIGMNALRIRIFRIVNTLKECVLNCVHNIEVQ
jgi:hypothetical protein